MVNLVATIAERAKSLQPHADTDARACSVRRSYGTKAAATLAAEFKVCPKAIRDVWSHKTWVDRTRPFWNLADGMQQGVTSPALFAACARVTAALGVRLPGQD